MLNVGLKSGGQYCIAGILRNETYAETVEVGVADSEHVLPVDEQPDVPPCEDARL